MRVLDTTLDGPILLEPTLHGDARGFFLESYRANVWAQHGVDDAFVQDNHSRSRRGVLRGMHFSVGAGQAKLVRCARGRILDVVVVGFAHGFCVLSDVADVTYKCSTYYDSAVERGFHYADPDVAIAWPQDTPLLVSERDMHAPALREIAGELAF